MKFSLSREQTALRDSVVAMARAELGRDLARRDREQVFDAAGWQACARAGLAGLPIPAQYGGRGADPVATMVAMEALGYGCADNGLNFGLNAHLWGCATPLSVFGSEAQKARLLPGLCSGAKIGALAMSETEAGSDAYAVQARAEKRGAHYVLNGRKVYITNAPIADVVIVVATVDPAKKAHGLTAFIVEKGTKGLALPPLVEKMGLRTIPMGEVLLEDCSVPEENRLGREGGGMALFHHAMEWERGFILAAAAGAMQRLMEQCRERARTRRQFGKAIGGFEPVSGKIVDMQLRLETGRLLLYKLAALKAEGKPAVMEAAMAKLHLSEAWVQACQDAIQIHGAHGYLTESGVERELRDALASRLYSGTSEIQRQVIARWMGLA